ncbi:MULTISPECIES: UrcA family protein [unclassified Phenylobacterium]
MLLLAAAALAGAAQAEPRRELLMARVVISDLDLTSAAGAAAMLARLNGAARELCTQPRSQLFPGREGREWRCRREAVAAAVARLKAPPLTLAYAQWLSAEPAERPPSPWVR